MYIPSRQLKTKAAEFMRYGREIQVNMRTADTSTFSFPCICDPVKFYRKELMLLTALTKCYGCDGMRAAVPSSFSEKYRLKRVY
jgi:hypothetical protein